MWCDDSDMMVKRREGEESEERRKCGEQMGAG